MNKVIQVFYRKDRKKRVVEIVFNNRTVEDQILLTVTRAIVESEDGEFLFEDIYSSREEFEATMANFTNKLESFGWNQDFDQVLKAQYNVYPDGALMPCIVKNEIDSLEGLTFPVFLHQTPENSISLSYSGGKVRNLPTDIQLSEEVMAKLKEVDEATRSPFNFYLVEDEVIVSDVMLLEVPYYIRLNILDDLDGIVSIIKPTKIEDNAFLQNYLNVMSGEINIIGDESMSTPGFTALHAYKFKAIATNRGIVLGNVDNSTICIDPYFETDVVVIKKVEAKKSDVISYQADAKLEEQA